MSIGDDRDGGAVRTAQLDSGIPFELPEATKEPCNECPWRKVAAPGYLGPHSAMEWIRTAMSETPIACHKTIEADPETGVGDWNDGKMRQCRGAASFRANICKAPRRSDVAAEPTSDAVFENPTDFIDHHEE